MATPRKRPEDKLKAGRPTTYCKEMADRICELVATTSFGLQRLCELYDELPDKTTVNLWRYKHPEFSTQYAQAKLKQADLLAEEILDIADDSTNDWMLSLDDDQDMVGWKLNGDHVNRCRLRIDTRKWLAAKLLPRQYGNEAKDEKQSTDTSVLEKILNGEITINNK